MTPYGIVYRDTVPSVSEGSGIWQKRSGIVSKGYVALSLILISLLIIGVNRIILSFYDEPELYNTSNIILTVLEIASLTVMMFTSIRKNIKEIFMGTNFSKNLKQAVLREEDIEFSTPFSKSNYFYDEIESVVEGVYSVNIIIEKGNLPVCISKTGVAKGDIERFILILKDKMKDRYTFEKKVGGNTI